MFTILVIIICAIVAFSIFASAKPRINKKKQYQYALKSGIMTQTEQAFYRTLISYVGEQYLVFPQVRLSSLLSEKVKGQNWKAALWRINQKSVDFVVCRVDTLNPVIAIELDDYTHERADRKQRDTSVEQIFMSVNFPLLRFKVGTPSDDIAMKLRQTLNL